MRELGIPTGGSLDSDLWPVIWKRARWTCRWRELTGLGFDSFHSGPQIGHVASFFHKRPLSSPMSPVIVTTSTPSLIV